MEYSMRQRVRVILCLSLKISMGGQVYTKKKPTIKMFYSVYSLFPIEVRAESSDDDVYTHKICTIITLV